MSPGSIDAFMLLKMPPSEVDGVVKTIFLFFLDAVPGEERVAEGERKEPVGRLEFPLRGSTITTQSSSPLDG
jgi:hypothetical protein